MMCIFIEKISEVHFSMARQSSIILKLWTPMRFCINCKFCDKKRKKCIYFYTEIRDMFYTCMRWKNPKRSPIAKPPKLWLDQLSN